MHLHASNIEKLSPFVKPKISRKANNELFNLTESYIEKGLQKIPMKRIIKELRDKINLQKDIAYFLFGMHKKGNLSERFYKNKN